MFKVSNVGICYSTICDMWCDHCILQNYQRITMPKNIAESITHQACLYKIKSVTFTGGEPMIFLKDIEDIMFRYKNNVSFDIITNALWAKNSEKKDIVKTLEKLKMCGLSHISLSTDEFHQKFVPIETIKLVAILALEHGLQVTVMYTMTKSSSIENFRELERIGAIIRKNQLVPIHPMLITKAPKLRIGDLIQPCSVVGQILVMPNGDVFACCGGRVMYVEKDSVLYRGNVYKEKMSRILKEIEDDWLLEVLHLWGPAKLLSLIGDPDSLRSNSYYCTCDICYHILKDSAYVKEIKAKLSEESVSRKLIKRKVSTIRKEL